MVKIQNTDAINAIRNSARLSISEGFPSELKGDVQAVIDMTPNFHRYADYSKANNVLSNATSAILLTTEVNRDFYITSLTLSLTKDVTSQTTICTIRGIINGASCDLMAINGLSLTAQHDSMALNFYPAVKVDRGSVISIISDSAVANIKASATVTGYYVN